MDEWRAGAIGEFDKQPGEQELRRATADVLGLAGGTVTTLQSWCYAAASYYGSLGGLVRWPLRPCPTRTIEIEWVRAAFAPSPPWGND